MKTDREIVEYLDESVCWHEWKLRGYGAKKCDKCNAIERVDFELPTLEWMLERLHKKYLDVKFEHIGCCEISTELWEDPMPTVIGYGKTPILALRGAVEKMVESK